MNSAPRLPTSRPDQVQLFPPQLKRNRQVFFAALLTSLVFLFSFASHASAEENAAAPVEISIPNIPVPAAVEATPKPHDFNEDIYYRNKLELSTEFGVLPINIPFVFDVFVDNDYSQKPLHYTLVPTLESVRWHVDGIEGPWILRGNFDVTATLGVTAIPRGPESHYVAFILGARRNFVPRNSRIAAYFDYRMGVGNIDAQEPHGVKYAQGQDLTFTLMMGSGARYNFNPKYSATAGFNYMHVSNLYLSEPKYPNNGINVWGPWIGFNMRLGRPKQKSS